jgi:hypothetical protein
MFSCTSVDRLNNDGPGPEKQVFKDFWPHAVTNSSFIKHRTAPPTDHPEVTTPSSFQIPAPQDVYEEISTLVILVLCENFIKKSLLIPPTLDYI